jgi:hypothetical protein
MPIPIHVIPDEHGQGDQVVQDPINGAVTKCVRMNIHLNFLRSDDEQQRYSSMYGVFVHNSHPILLDWLF